MLTDDDLLRYSRHLLLPGFDVVGQEKLKAASVLIVGLGGLGGPAALFLAAAGVGRLILADDDAVELSNLQRQIAHTQNDLGRSKVESAAHSVRQQNPAVAVETRPLRLHEEQLDEQLQAVDLVVDASDNFATRFAINRACVRAGKPLVSGAAIRAEGQVSVFHPAAGGPCYRCLYRDGSDDRDLSCSQNGVLAPLVGVVGAWQAAEAIKVLAGYGDPLRGRLLVLDLFTAQTRVLNLPARADCPVCAGAGLDA